MYSKAAAAVSKNKNTLKFPKPACSAWWPSGLKHSLAESWTGFDPGFERPTCLATLKSSDRTKQFVCG